MTKQEIIIDGWGDFWELLPKEHQEYALLNNGFVCIKIGSLYIKDSLKAWDAYYATNSEMVSTSITNANKQACFFVMPGIIYKNIKKYHPNNNLSISKEYKYL